MVNGYFYPCWHCAKNYGTEEKWKLHMSGNHGDSKSPMTPYMLVGECRTWHETHGSKSKPKSPKSKPKSKPKSNGKGKGEVVVATPVFVAPVVTTAAEQSITTTTTKTTYVNTCGNSKDVRFLLDISGSMNGNSLIQAKIALEDIVKKMDPSTMFSIVTFNDYSNVILEPCLVAEILSEGKLPNVLNPLRAYGRTALYDTIGATAEKIHPHQNVQMIVLTDGDDTCSQKYMRMESVEKKLKDYSHVQLDIVHIDGSGKRNTNYEALCKNRGNYIVIKEETVVQETLNRIVQG